MFPTITIMVALILLSVNSVLFLFYNDDSLEDKNPDVSLR